MVWSEEQVAILSPCWLSATRITPCASKNASLITCRSSTKLPGVSIPLVRRPLPFVPAPLSDLLRGRHVSCRSSPCTTHRSTSIGVLRGAHDRHDRDALGAFLLSTSKPVRSDSIPFRLPCHSLSKGRSIRVRTRTRSGFERKDGGGGSVVAGIGIRS